MPHENPGTASPNSPRITDGSDTMLAWERFLTGEPDAAPPSGHFVISSWRRSLRHGVDPTARAAPLAVSGEGVIALRNRHRDLLAAASGVFAEVEALLTGSRCIMSLTNASGVVLDAVGDVRTLEEAEEIHLIRGGDWREAAIGTNGIGTALATGRPAHIHGPEHFCEGIKRWTCAGAPVFEPGTQEILGVVDISGPPFTYQRNNLTLAVTAARQIETALAEHAAKERMRLLEVCLQRISSGGAAGLIALDRIGRLVHATGRVPNDLDIGERVPGLDRDLPIEHWALRLPEGWRPEWLNPVSVDGRPIGAVLIVPEKPRSATGSMIRPPVKGSENDPSRSSFDHIIGRSPAATALIKRASQLVGRQVPLLIEGETGVGKELLARAIHDDEDDRRPFIAFNCGAVSKELVAAELFGHVPGAFTGATREGRPGRFELAHQGTLCLDEIGEMPLDLQPVLLRVLEEGIVYRVGDTNPRRVNARLIAITNRDLNAEVEAGRFRRDLYYRIGVTSIKVPALRERTEDIEPLVDHFNRVLSARHHVPMLRFAPGVMAALRSMPWPGNVRELRNLIERLLLTIGDETVNVADVSLAPTNVQPTDAKSPDPGPASLDDAERDAIMRAVHHERGNLAAAARRLGVSRSTIYRKIGRYLPEAPMLAPGEPTTKLR